VPPSSRLTVRQALEPVFLLKIHSGAEPYLAHRLIEALADKWKPDEFHDTYTEVLRKAIEAKVEG
jgi:non-homologous end joining protein Ku